MSAASDATPPGPLSRLGLVTVVSTVLIDQVTKLLADSLLDPGRFIDILPILQLHLTANPGVAFSFLYGSNSTVLLLGVVAITIGVVVFWARSREGGRLAAAGFGLIVGGAVGNIVDRIVHGEVIDFLLLHFGDRTLFVFNLADFALTLGPLCLIIAYLRPAGRPASP